MIGLVDRAGMPWLSSKGPGRLLCIPHRLVNLEPQPRVILGKPIAACRQHLHQPCKERQENPDALGSSGTRAADLDLEQNYRPAFCQLSIRLSFFSSNTNVVLCRQSHSFVRVPPPFTHLLQYRSMCLVYDVDLPLCTTATSPLSQAGIVHTPVGLG
jgi:hypothetical protein